jgi:hypothetical protein
MLFIIIIMNLDIKMKICPQCNFSKDELEFKTKKRINKICNVCKSEKGKKDSIRGTANEYLVLGALMCDFPNVMMSSSAQTAHDLIVHQNESMNIRIQVKTVTQTNSIPLEGGKRAGSDGEYGGEGTVSKKYSYSSKNCDLLIGIKNINICEFELYFIPGLVLDKLNQGSISSNKVSFTKNDLSVLRKSLDKKYAEEFLKLISRK